jgi:hypothetical protein
VLPAAEHVDELQVNHLGLVLLGELEELVGRLWIVVAHGRSSIKYRQTLRQRDGSRNR